MELRYGLLCDFANATQEGKLNVIGIFDRLYAVTFPAVHRQLFLVTSISTEPEDEGASREINIQMIKVARKMIRLSIADNGVGLPPDWNNILNNSLGLKLMQGLSDDIHGRFSIVNKDGTKVVIEFGEELIPNEMRNRERTEITELQT